jgi:hypothetical protein
MKPDQLKSRMANLPEEGQNALAELALIEMKKRSRLEQLAAGSIWNRFGLIFPIVGSGAFLGFRGSLADYLPFIIIFLLFVIQGVSASIHSRIDAIYELMKMDERKCAPDNRQEAEQAVQGNTN